MNSTSKLGANEEFCNNDERDEKSEYEDNGLVADKKNEKYDSMVDKPKDIRGEEHASWQCFRFWAVLLAVGIIALLVYLLTNTASGKEKSGGQTGAVYDSQSRDKFKGNRNSYTQSGYYHGSRGGGPGVLAGYYFSKGLGAIYHGSRAGGTRLGGAGRGGWGGGAGRGGGGGGGGGWGCFSENSLIWTKNETTPDTQAEQIKVKHLNEGSLVGTIYSPIKIKGSYEFTWTRATDVTVSRGNWTAHTFTFDNAGQLTVTSPHLMIIRKNDISYFIRADEVNIGDLMLVKGHDVPITKIKNHMIETKVSIETEDGTVKVNDVLVSGICEYNPEVVNRVMKRHVIIDRYIQDHFGKDYSNMCMDDIAWKKRYMVNNGYKDEMK